MTTGVLTAEPVRSDTASLHTEQQSPQQVALRLLPQLEQLAGILDRNSVYEAARAQLAPILGAVRQVSSGAIPAAHASTSERVLGLQTEINKIVAEYSAVTCYPQVTVIRGQMTRARGFFAVLNQVSEELVSYAPSEQRKDVALHGLHI